MAWLGDRNTQQTTLHSNPSLVTSRAGVLIIPPLSFPWMAQALGPCSKCLTLDYQNRAKSIHREALFVGEGGTTVCASEPDPILPPPPLAPPLPLSLNCSRSCSGGDMVLRSVDEVGSRTTVRQLAKKGIRNFFFARENLPRQNLHVASVFVQDREIGRSTDLHDRCGPPHRSEGPTSELVRSNVSRQGKTALGLGRKEKSVRPWFVLPTTSPQTVATHVPQRIHDRRRLLPSPSEPPANPHVA